MTTHLYNLAQIRVWFFFLENHRPELMENFSVLHLSLLTLHASGMLKLEQKTFVLNQ